MDNSEILNNLFDKTIECPICGNKFNQKCVKAKTARIISKDSDFFVKYKGINPYFYDIWVCDTCGYSAPKYDFQKIKSFQKDLVLLELSPKWKPRSYPETLTPELAIERYKLALLTTKVTQKPISNSGMLLLKIAWMYRLSEKSDKENQYLEMALSSFVSAFQNESFPICGMQRDSFTYLIGELYRRVGNYEQSLLWLIVSTNTSSIIKELARDAKDLVKEAQKIEIKNTENTEN